MRLIRIMLLAAVAAALGFAILMRAKLPAAERGRRLAERQGCFACHGPAGTRGAANPGRRDRTVPTFAGDLMMYADDANDVRAWILDGVTARKRDSKSWREQREAGVLRMPAFRGRFSHAQVEDLVAYVLAVSDSPEPGDSLALAGRERAKQLGCTGCHGFGGRLALPNPGSLKGYVPSWDGADFPELVQNETEFGEWVEHGVSRRFAGNPAAKFFLERSRLHMPAYGKRLADGDVARLWAYARWLQSPGARPDSATVTSF